MDNRQIGNQVNGAFRGFWGVFLSTFSLFFSLVVFADDSLSSVVPANSSASMTSPLSSDFTKAATDHSASSADTQPAWSTWQVVGRAQLKWLFFDVYQSQLLTPNGRYSVSDGVSTSPLALYIRYQRSIDKQELLDATKEQWQTMGIFNAQSPDWLVRLGEIFPSVNDGDRLVYQSEKQNGRFYFSQQNKPFKPIGAIDDAALNEAFLAIWLSPKSAYPNLRRQLIGQDK